MKKFNFEYDSSVKKISCIYTYNNEVTKTTRWDGYIITTNIDGVLNIEGYEIDKMDSKENGKAHLRYINGVKAISMAHNSLSFEVYPGNIAPISYTLHYNEEDGCFYGYWIFNPSVNHIHPTYGGGEAVVRIEDVKTLENEQLDVVGGIIDRISPKYREEYEHEMGVAAGINHQLISTMVDSEGAVKKMSRYSSEVKK